MFDPQSFSGRPQSFVMLVDAARWQLVVSGHWSVSSVDFGQLSRNVSSEHGRQNDIHATGVDKGWGGDSRPRPQYCQVIYRKRDGWRDFFVFLEITVVWLRYPAAGWPRSRFEF